MGKSKKKYRTPHGNQVKRGNRWYNHYFQYLTALAYQLFEWKNLPEGIDPRYLEMSLHQYGYVGFYKDPVIGFIASQGALSGTINHYLLSTHFHATSPVYQKTFPIYHYNDTPEPNAGVVIYNNDQHFSTIPSLDIFAEDLAELKEVIYVNQNAQKTPYVFKTNPDNLLSIKNIYKQVDENTPALFIDDSIGNMGEMVDVLNTTAPYVVDKLNTQKNAVWNEVMTYLGINNANLEKRERMITSEADSNNEQITSSGSVFLKSREEACDRINRLYGLNVEVGYRSETIEKIQETSERGID